MQWKDLVERTMRGGLLETSHSLFMDLGMEPNLKEKDNMKIQ